MRAAANKRSEQRPIVVSTCLYKQLLLSNSWQILNHVALSGKADHI